jgi:hypothetical protein
VPRGSRFRNAVLHLFVFRLIDFYTSRDSLEGQRLSAPYFHSAKHAVNLMEEQHFGAHYLES